MIPADKSFKADNLARDEVDLRLVVEHKLALIQGVMQIGRARPVLIGCRCCVVSAPRAFLDLGESVAQPAQFQLARYHIGQALQRAKVLRLYLLAGLFAEDS